MFQLQAPLCPQGISPLAPCFPNGLFFCHAVGPFYGKAKSAHVLSFTLSPLLESGYCNSRSAQGGNVTSRSVPWLKRFTAPLINGPVLARWRRKLRSEPVWSC